jgi:hypothetical protein
VEDSNPAAKLKVVKSSCGICGISLAAIDAVSTERVAGGKIVAIGIPLHSVNGQVVSQIHSVSPTRSKTLTRREELGSKGEDTSTHVLD